MDKSWLISAAFGGGLLIAGLLMMRSHFRAWQGQKSDPELAPAERKFFRRRFRRRMQASGMMALIGVMLPIGDSVMLFGPAPGWFALYWTIVLVLVLWMILLALSDLISTRTHSSIALNKLRARQRELEREATEFRKQLISRQNGSGSAETDANATE